MSTHESITTNSVKPVHGVGEWAAHSVNIQDGCLNDCRYCYAKSLAIRFGRATPQTWGIAALRTEPIEKPYRKRSGRIMFPTSHDITMDNLPACLIVLRKMLASGNDVLIVSKPNVLCVTDLCHNLQDHKAKLTFRFTVGSADSEILDWWEPHAPSFEDRLAALELARQQGYMTSVSCEPMLDLHIDKVIDAVRPFVSDAIWLGRANRLRQIIAVNCPNDPDAQRRVSKLLKEQTDEYLRGLYERYRRDPLIRFKDSIKKVAGLERPVERGLDI